ncbi:histone-lysine N-methyltransferase, H3 lysine-79 specific-like [Bombus vosnesenskii]|uniref:Histone-lysine N-methyltransferase, H3 lysine-79 specific-like n=1 Tax=Bombus vosnesenskii TaxID=207650 RepID=A0A6J3L0I4_9HYME|nr:histone-lysine N-methyltransferase, H3 lysine-79 specific-like [Bombus vosnesenskii]
MRNEGYRMEGEKQEALARHHAGSGSDGDCDSSDNNDNNNNDNDNDNGNDATTATTTNEQDCREGKRGKVEVEVDVELEVVATKKVIEEGEYGKEAERKRKRWVEADRNAGKKEKRGLREREREISRRMGEIERRREEEIDEKRRENIRGSPGRYERGKAERRNSKIVENVYAPSGWPRFSQDLLSRQHFSLSSVPLVQCMGKPLLAARSRRKSQMHTVHLTNDYTCLLTILPIVLSMIY